jgi:hypothetical protein
MPLPPDYHYFGPPIPGCPPSPYWPQGLPWNPRRAKETVGELLDGLGAIVEAGPYGALPTTLRCVCPAPFCLLPIVDRVCEVHQIRRAPIPRPAIIDAISAPIATRGREGGLRHATPPRDQYRSSAGEEHGPGRACDVRKWVLLVPRIAEGPRGSSLRIEAGPAAVKAALYHAALAGSAAETDKILAADWEVDDLDALADAVSTENSELWCRLLAAIRINT